MKKAVFSLVVLLWSQLALSQNINQLPLEFLDFVPGEKSVIFYEDVEIWEGQTRIALGTGCTLHVDAANQPRVIRAQREFLVKPRNLQPLGDKRIYEIELTRKDSISNDVVMYLNVEARNGFIPVGFDFRDGCSPTVSLKLDPTLKTIRGAGNDDRLILLNSHGRGLSVEGKSLGQGGFTSYYVGQFNKDIQSHGKGVLTMKGGAFYRGEWINGLKHGKFTYTNENGDEFTQRYDNGDMLLNDF